MVDQSLLDCWTIQNVPNSATASDQRCHANSVGCVLFKVKEGSGI